MATLDVLNMNVSGGGGGTSRNRPATRGDQGFRPATRG